MVTEPCPAPATAGRVAGPVKVERYPDDLEITEDLAVGFRLDFVDETVHRLRYAGEIATEPLAVESCRHRVVIVGRDADDARDVADAAVVIRAVDRRNEFVLRVLDVLVVFAELVAVVRLAVEEGHDQ